MWKCSLWFAIFERIWYLFERRGVSRSKKIVIHSNGLGYLFSKSCHRFEKKVIRLNGLGYPFNRSNDWSYLFKDKFQPSFHLKTISSLATHVKQSVILQVMYVTKFVYKRIIYE